jgi:hypothetical protein
MTKTLVRAFILSSLSAWAVWAGAGNVALASDQSISVLGLEPAAGAPDSIATAVTEALRQRVTSTSGYRLVPGRDLVEVKLVFSCPDEAPPCMTQAAQSIGASKVIFGNLQPVGMDAYLVTLKLLDGERGVVATWISEQITKAQASPVALRVPVQKWFATLTGQAQAGSLKLTGGVIGAGVWLDGAQAGLLGADGLTIVGVAAGPHQLAVTKAGYEKFERNITMASGASEKIAVQLKAVETPGTGTVELSSGPAGGSPLTTMPAEGETPPAGNVGFRVAAWATLGVGLLGIATGVYASYRVSDVNSKLDPYRRFPCSNNPADVSCKEDRTTKGDVLTADDQKFISDQQKTGDAYTTAQWIGYGVGAAFVITSGVFFYQGYLAKPSGTTASRKRSNLIVMPTFAPGSAGGMAYMTF